ncbi:MAG: twitch domain-containing radical SAM protein [Deltaproteobacteria bacterium]|nr:twitch domain-containing radical SAM protein [Deltaproteobacteria bacterium]
MADFPFRNINPGISDEAIADPYEFGRISETFCALPFTHLATHTDGSAILCCVAKNEQRLNLNDQTLQAAWNSDYLRSARLKMLKGENVSACTHCYAEEKNGYRSHRVTENRVWKERFGRDFVLDRVRKTQSDGRLNEDIVAIDLRLGNTCNLQCVMCRPQDSSRWTALAKKIAETAETSEIRSEWAHKSKINQSRFEWYKDPAFWTDLEAMLPSMREIIVGGGEPMLLEEHRRLVEACVRTGAAKNIQIRYHTNGTLLDKSLFDLWKEFKLVEVFISLDCWGEKNNYMRYPANWEAISNNLKCLDEESPESVKVMLLCSVHLMNMFYLDEYAQWVEDQNFRKVTKGFNGYFHPGVVHYPPYLSIQNYPSELKKAITEKLVAFENRSRKKSNKIQGIINLMNEADHSSRLNQTRDYIRRLDAERGTSFSKTFPELNRFLEI